MSYGTATPYIASYVLVRKGDKIAFVLRANTSWMNNHYGLPSGKVEKDESFAEAAVREAKEEIGIIVEQKALTPVLTVHRRDKDSPKAMYWVDVYFEVAEWAGEPHNAEPDMHSELAWLSLSDLPDNVIPSTKHALEQLALGQSYCEYGWE